MNTESEPTKKCNRCGEVKPLTEFYRAAGCADGHRGACKVCTLEKQSEHKQKPEVAAKTREYMAAYRADPANRHRMNARQRQRYAENDNGFRDRVEAYRRTPQTKLMQRGYQERRNVNPGYRERQRARKQSPEYKAWRRNWYKDRAERDEEFRLSTALRSLVRVVLRATGTKKAVRTTDLLGYSTKELRERIECQFSPGMSWDNHGDWHIDHKKPVAEFIRQGVTDPRIINMLCNLQPLWAADNIVKRDKWSLPANDNFHVGSKAA